MSVAYVFICNKALETTCYTGQFSNVTSECLCEHLEVLNVNKKKLSSTLTLSDFMQPFIFLSYLIVLFALITE